MKRIHSFGQTLSLSNILLNKFTYNAILLVSLKKMRIYIIFAILLVSLKK